jgi:MSHA biogenesis protein MshM
MVDERGTSPVIILDEAQHLSDKFLTDLSGFLNFTFDSRDLLTLWLAGLTPLRKHLQMQQHAALKTRVAVEVHLDPLDRETFGAFIDHGLKAAGATSKLLSEPALELLFRSSRGLPRVASVLLRAALRTAHERDQSFVDEHVLDAAIEESSLPAAARS